MAVRLGQQQEDHADRIHKTSRDSSLDLFCGRGALGLLLLGMYVLQQEFSTNTSPKSFLVGGQECKTVWTLVETVFLFPLQPNGFVVLGALWRIELS